MGLIKTSYKMCHPYGIFGFNNPIEMTHCVTPGFNRGKTNKTRSKSRRDDALCNPRLKPGENERDKVKIP